MHVFGSAVAFCGQLDLHDVPCRIQLRGDSRPDRGIRGIGVDADRYAGIETLNLESLPRLKKLASIIRVRLLQKLIVVG